MVDLWVARDKRRKALFLPMEGTKENPNTIIPLYKMEAQELNDLIDGVLAKRGIPIEKRAAIKEEAERLYENKIRTYEASVEIRRRLEGQVPHMRKRGGKWQSTL